MAASLRPPIAIKIQPHVHHSNGHHQPSPPSPLTRGPGQKNMYARQSGDEDSSPACSSPSPIPTRMRHSGAPTTAAAASLSARRNSLLDGIKEIMGRPRSGSVGVNAIPNGRRSVLEKQGRQMVKVQVNGCNVSSVYDLREPIENGGDFYDDEWGFRRPRSNSSDFLILRKTSRPLSVDVIGLVDKQDDPYRQYLKAITCYDLAPHAGTVIMLDSRITAHKAFLALTEAAHPAALVWDAARSRIVRLVTQTDFLSVLLDASPTVHFNTLAQCFEHLGTSGDVLTVAPANMRLLDVAEMFCDKRVHRIPVIETDNNVNDVLFLITLERILQAVHKQHRSLHFAPWMGRSVAKAAVGKWQELRTVTKDSSLRDAVELMVTEGLSSVPVVERPNSLKPTDVLCKADVVRLLATTKSEQPTNLYSTIMTATVDDALRSRDPRDNIDPPFCSFKDSVVSVIDKTLAYKDFRCIFALDDAGRLMGAISVSDLMRHIMMQRIRPPLTG